MSLADRASTLEVNDTDKESHSLRSADCGMKIAIPTVLVCGGADTE